MERKRLVFCQVLTKDLNDVSLEGSSDVISLFLDLDD